jgi:RimJ/RimL family protein N-acetyltransferase
VCLDSGQEQTAHHGFPKNMEVINDLKMFFINLKHERHDLVVYWHEKEWEMLLKAIFQNDRVWVASRCYYENDIANLMMASNNPEGYEIREVHEVASGEYENQNDLFEEMCSETPDVPTFLRNGFGFCAATAHDLIGWCLSEYNNASGCEVGIWVSEKWRGQGVAKTLLFRFICEARRRGLTRIGWSSFSDNAPSVSTAESIGLMKIKDYHAMYVEW